METTERRTKAKYNGRHVGRINQKLMTREKVNACARVCVCVYVCVCVCVCVCELVHTCLLRVRFSRNACQHECAGASVLSFMHVSISMFITRRASYRVQIWVFRVQI